MSRAMMRLITGPNPLLFLRQLYQMTLSCQCAPSVGLVLVNAHFVFYLKSSRHSHYNWHCVPFPSRAETASQPSPEPPAVEYTADGRVRRAVAVGAERKQSTDKAGRKASAPRPRKPKTPAAEAGGFTVDHEALVGSFLWSDEVRQLSSAGHLYMSFEVCNGKRGNDVRPERVGQVTLGMST
jgi:hypothetical protein